MSVAEMKVELIIKITTIDNERVLNEVMALLNNATATQQARVNLTKNYDAIKEQYGDVLQKLAQ